MFVRFIGTCRRFDCLTIGSVEGATTVCFFSVISVSFGAFFAFSGALWAIMPPPTVSSPFKSSLFGTTFRRLLESSEIDLCFDVSCFLFVGDFVDESMLECLVFFDFRNGSAFDCFFGV